MHKYLMEAAVFFILMLSVFGAHAITATELIKERIKTITSPSELMELMKQAPSLTHKEKEKAKKYMKAHHHNDSCSHPSCYPKCMLSFGVASCCNGTVCIGGICSGKVCIGNPSRSNEFASLACGIRCL